MSSIASNLIVNVSRTPTDACSGYAIVLVGLLLPKSPGVGPSPNPYRRPLRARSDAGSSFGAPAAPRYGTAIGAHGTPFYACSCSRDREPWGARGRRYRASNRSGCRGRYLMLARNFANNSRCRSWSPAKRSTEIARALSHVAVDPLQRRLPPSPRSRPDVSSARRDAGRSRRTRNRRCARSPWPRCRRRPGSDRRPLPGRSGCAPHRARSACTFRHCSPQPFASGPVGNQPSKCRPARSSAAGAEPPPQMRRPARADAGVGPITPCSTCQRPSQSTGLPRP